MPKRDWRKGLETRTCAERGIYVVTRRGFAAGERIGYFEGEPTMVDTMHTIHLEGRTIHGIGILRNLAHSCAPNAHFLDGRRWLHSLQPIGAGEEVTIDYLATEPVISTPFLCRCGALVCRGYISTPLRAPS